MLPGLGSCGQRHYIPGNRICLHRQLPARAMVFQQDDVPVSKMTTHEVERNLNRLCDCLYALAPILSQEKRLKGVGIWFQTRKQ